MNIELKLLDEVDALQKQGRTSEVIYLLENLAIQALNSLGVLYSEHSNNKQKSLNCLKTAIMLDSSDWTLHNNMGHVCNLYEDFEQALEHSYKSSELSDHQNSVSLFNCAVTLMNMNRTQQALPFYERSLELCDNSINRFNLAHCQLLEGLYEQGWKNYESRLDHSTLIEKFKHRLKSPAWDGNIENLNQKTIYIYSEQGYGDVIHFCRFIPKLKEAGFKKIYFEVQEALASLIKKSFSFLEVIPRGHTNYPEAPSTDYKVSVCSLPYLFNMINENNFYQDSYLVCDQKTEFDCPENAIKVGIAWAGNPTHGYDFRRSLFLKNFCRFNQIENVYLFALQKEKGFYRKWGRHFLNLNEDAQDVKYVDLSDTYNNFEECAEVIKGLDLVITLDSAIAHLAGALGKDVWVCIPTITDWRWGRKANSTPWYPTMRLFRQKKSKAWEDVFEEINQELVLFSSNKANLS